MGSIDDTITDPDPKGKVNQKAICEEAIEDMSDDFDAVTIPTAKIKLFFEDLVSKCQGTAVDYVTAVAELIDTQTNACGCVTSFVNAINAELADLNTDKRFNERISFQSGFCAVPQSCFVMEIEIDDPLVPTNQNNSVIEVVPTLPVIQDMGTVTKN